MVAVITSATCGAFAATLAQMHRDRKTVFVDQLGWDLPVVDNEQELDEYDTDAAIYLVAHDGEGGHLGSVRLVSTVGAHLLRDKFPHLCDRLPPAGDDIWEITRLCTTPGLKPAHALQIRMELVVALIEYALTNGITRYTMMTHIGYLPALEGVGWQIERLGQPHVIGRETVVALQIGVALATLERLGLPPAIVPVALAA